MGVYIYGRQREQGGGGGGRGGRGAGGGGGRGTSGDGNDGGAGRKARHQLLHPFRISWNIRKSGSVSRRMKLCET